MKSCVKSFKKAVSAAAFPWQILIVALFILLLLCARHLTGGVIQSLGYVGEVLIPSIFPFAVLSGIYTQVCRNSTPSPLAQRISAFLHLSPISLGALMLGILSGFPLGGKYVSDLYNQGKISRNEAERLFPMVNNPSVAFVTVGVGQGMLGSVSSGVLLYLCVLVSAYVIGVIGKHEVMKNTEVSFTSCAPLSLPAIIRDATLTTVHVSGFVILFGALGSLISALLGGALSTVLLLVLEVTGACARAAELSFATPVRMGILAFALGFGGLCVGMQSEVYLNSATLSSLSYYKRKLLQSVICAVLCYLLSICLLV